MKLWSMRCATSRTQSTLLLLRMGECVERSGVCELRALWYAVEGHTVYGGNVERLRTIRAAIDPDGVMGLAGGWKF